MALKTVALFLASIALVLLFQVQESHTACTDASSFVYSGTTTNCEQAAGDYSLATVCTSRFMNRYCCKSCTPTTVNNVELIAEGFFVLDHKNLELYLKEEKGDEAKAREMLLEDTKFFITDANVFYETLKPYGLHIQLRIAGIQILDKDIVSGREITNGNDVNEDVMINNFRDFLQTKDAALKDSEYDFSILLTGYNLQDPVAGYARASTMCLDGHAYGIVETQGLMADVTTLTHEIGHIFGAMHDPADQAYVMSSNGSPTEDLDRYIFSYQSAYDMQNYLSSGTIASSCLLSSATSSKSEIPDVTPANYTGKLQDINTICSRYAGFPSSPCTDSYFYQGGISGDSVCKLVACHTDDQMCGMIRPTEGMPCGNNKSCKKGLCVNDPRPETADIDDDCIFGDDLLPYGEAGYTCESIIASEGAIACQTTIEKTCCETCKKYQTGIPGCPYGNERIFRMGWKTTDCDGAVRDYGESAVCKDPETSQWCCEKCANAGYEIVQKEDSGSTGGSGPSKTDKSVCEDESSFEINGVPHNCIQAIYNYGVDTVCTHDDLKQMCCGSCSASSGECTDVESLQINEEMTTCTNAVSLYGSDQVCGHDTVKNYCCATCSSYVQNNAGTQQSGSHASSGCIDETNVNVNGEITTCQATIQLFGEQLVCEHEMLKDSCCVSCAAYNSRKSDQTSGSSGSSGCVDESNIIINNEITTCKTSMLTYGSNQVCEHDTLKDACCASCASYYSSCQDVSSFRIRRRKYTCSDVITIYGLSGVCSDANMKNNCCGSCRNA